MVFKIFFKSTFACGRAALISPPPGEFRVAQVLSGVAILMIHHSDTSICAFGVRNQTLKCVPEGEVHEYRGANFVLKHKTLHH